MRGRTPRDEPSSALAPAPEHMAAYIADMTAELAELAHNYEFELLAYLLEMANLEAASAAPRRAGASALR